MQYDLPYWDHKSIRDPLYGFIHLSARESALIGTSYMHRLTRIKQLAHTYLVYPSAVHTRFEHSLGILHIADRMCQCFGINDKKREVIRCAALLHDVGHGPFSHLFEEIMARINGPQFSHESITTAILKYDTEISSILKGYVPGHDSKLLDIKTEVLKIIDKSSTDLVSRSIISGQLDADKMDYLRRDSYHTGSTYGIFDLERVLSTLTIATEVGKDYPVTMEKGIPALESFRLARYSLYTQVIQHHTRLIADQMFLRALELAIFSEKIIPKIKFEFKGREKKFIEEFLSFDDGSIYELVLDKGKKSNSYSFQIMNDLKNRKLFKRIYSQNVSEIKASILMEFIKDNLAVEKYEQEIAVTAGVPRELIIIHLESEEPGLKSYRSFDTAAKSDELPFFYLDHAGKIKTTEDRFSLTIKGDAPKKLYVFARSDFKDRLAPVCKKRFE